MMRKSGLLILATALAVGSLWADNIGQTTATKVGWLDKSLWVSNVAPADDDGHEYWVTNGFQNTVGSAVFPRPLHLGAPAGSVLGNMTDITPTVNVQTRSISWTFSDLQWRGGSFYENCGAYVGDVNVIRGQIKLLGTQPHEIVVMSSSGSKGATGQVVRVAATLTGDAASTLTLERRSGTYTLAKAGVVGIVQMEGDSSAYNGSFATGGSKYFDTVFFTTDHPLGNPATPNAAALVLNEKAVLAFANGLTQSSNRGIRIDGDAAYLMTWTGKADDWTLATPVTKGSKAAAVTKDGPGTVSMSSSYAAGAITVADGTLKLLSTASFPVGQKFTVKSGATLYSQIVTNGFDIVCEPGGQAIFELPTLTVGYAAETSVVATPLQLASTYSTGGFVQPVALSESVIPFDGTGNHADTNRLLVAEIAAGAADVTAADFRDVTEKEHGLPETWFEVVKDGSGKQSVYLFIKPYVKSTADGFLNKDAYWTDGQMPHAGWDYLLVHLGKYDAALTFPGSSLTVAATAFKPYYKAGSYSLTVNDLRLAADAETVSNGGTATYDGHWTVLDEGVATRPRVVALSGSKPFVVTLNATLAGTGDLDLIATHATNNTYIALNGDNSEYLGSFFVTCRENEKRPVLVDDPLRRGALVKLASAASLGGALAEPRAAAVTLDKCSFLQATKSLDLNAANRGITVVSGGFDAPAGVTFTVSEPLTVNGPLLKTGDGTLALKCTTTASTAQTFKLSGGQLTPLTADCCANLDLVFTNRSAKATSILLDCANEATRTTGIVANSIVAEGASSVPVSFANAPKGQTVVRAICTLPHDETDRSAFFDVSAIRGYKAKVEKIAGATTDVYRLTAEPLGLVLFVK